MLSIMWPLPQPFRDEEHVVSHTKDNNVCFEPLGFEHLKPISNQFEIAKAHHNTVDSHIFIPAKVFVGLQAGAQLCGLQLALLRRRRELVHNELVQLLPTLQRANEGKREAIRSECTFITTNKFVTCIHWHQDSWSLPSPSRSSCWDDFAHTRCRSCARIGCCCVASSARRRTPCRCCTALCLCVVSRLRPLQQREWSVNDSKIKS